MNATPESPALPDGLRYARILGVALGGFLILTGLRDLLGIFPRWDPATVTWPRALLAASLFHVACGCLLLLPWRRLMLSRRWAWWLGLIGAVALVFSFMMISEVMAKNYLAKAVGLKAKPPIFQAVLLFAMMAQPPIAWFLRRPDTLD